MLGRSHHQCPEHRVYHPPRKDQNTGERRGGRVGEMDGERREGGGGKERRERGEGGRDG